jgi:hypothetical protein
MEEKRKIADMIFTPEPDSPFCALASRAAPYWLLIPLLPAPTENTHSSIENRRIQEQKIADLHKPEKGEKGMRPTCRAKNLPLHPIGHTRIRRASRLADGLSLNGHCRLNPA